MPHESLGPIAPRKALRGSVLAEHRLLLVHQVAECGLRQEDGLQALRGPWPTSGRLAGHRGQVVRRRRLSRTVKAARLTTGRDILGMLAFRGGRRQLHAGQPPHSEQAFTASVIGTLDRMLRQLPGHTVVTQAGRLLHPEQRAQSSHGEVGPPVRGGPARRHRRHRPHSPAYSSPAIRPSCRLDRGFPTARSSATSRMRWRRERGREKSRVGRHNRPGSFSFPLWMPASLWHRSSS
ncbi:hypothetical protein EES39_32195 [Streptomyces sp. ADI92-24]|nr:hypothetical protein EES39_32195 [Streptomyces sp. ADI92-24]